VRILSVDNFISAHTDHRNVGMTFKCPPRSPVTVSMNLARTGGLTMFTGLSLVNKRPTRVTISDIVWTFSLDMLKRFIQSKNRSECLTINDFIIS